ncbi:MAG TPA: outer membrane beta-barrel family protein [Flavitalea sp.]|nr:outer membrane beta-barrel family protein [Flavitalea sp.]
MRHLLLLFIFAGTCFVAAAQNKSNLTIKGKLTDTLFKESLAEATVSLLNPDSTVAAYAIATKTGEFELKNLDSGSYRLIVSFQGYTNYRRNIRLTGIEQVLDLGTINLEKKSVLLEEVVVEGAPIIIKKDTIEFKASAFKTRPNSTAEDVLKKIPGMQVDKDGNVKAQGEDVQKVVVDGKEFFGTDPKLATKNITADMIESIQVFDDMSDQAKFSRIDDGSRQKTINIKLKKEKRIGYFGRVTAGIGTDGRYESQLSFNRFNGDRRISIIGNSNNINKSTFNFSDIVTNMGGFQGGGGGGGNRGGGGGNQVIRIDGGGFGGFGGGGSGITKATSIGLNYSDKWKKVDVTGSYFYSESETSTSRNARRQSFFPDDSVAIQNQQSTSLNKNQNHRFNVRMEYFIDSMNSLLFTPSVTFQHSASRSIDTTFTRASKPGLEYLALTGITANSNERDGFSLNNNLLYRRRFHRIGRTLTVGFNNSINHSDGNGENYSPYTFFKPDGTTSTVRNQDIRTEQKTRTQNNVISTSYTEPLGLNKLLEFNYAYTDRENKSDRRAYDFNGVSGKYDAVNALQTNYFENYFYAHRGGVNFRMQKPKFNYQLGGAVEQSELVSRSIRWSTGKDTTVSQKFTNIFPTANFQYNFSNSKNFRIDYRGRTNQPSITQLQDVPDVSNPLQIRTGNPLLQQEFSNNINLRFNNFNRTTFKYFSAFINFGNTNNKIVNAIDSVPGARGVQLIRPVNLNGAFNSNAFVTYGIPLRTKKLKGSNLSFSTSGNYNRTVSQIYKQKNVTDNLIIGETVSINLNVKDNLNVGLNTTVNYNSAKYSIQKDLNEDFFSQSYGIDFSYTMFKSIVLTSDFDYYKSSGRTDGFNQSIPLWTAGIAKQLFKKKNGELKLSVNDILNQNESITRTVTDNYIEDINTVVLKRYFMLTFTYNLNRAGANNQQQMQPGRQMMPGGMQRQEMRIRN